MELHAAWIFVSSRSNPEHEGLVPVAAAFLTHSSIFQRDLSRVELSIVRGTEDEDFVFGG